ncbi:hypothetical protein [Undibacterium sp.]|nr:hypothetical protein [Undibacterium sp.]
MPIELRKWFQLSIASALMMAAIPGFFLLRLFLPLLLLKLWPGLER